MNTLVIGILGKIHSGKSTLAKELSQTLDIPIISFGGYLKSFSESNGLPIDRKSLQDLGNKRIFEDAMQFLADVLLNAGVNTDIVIIEGIRHVSVFNALKNMFKTNYFLYCDTSFEIRYNRYIDREETKNITVEEFKVIDEHIVEREIEILKEYCSVVTNDTQISDLKNDIGNYLKSQNNRI